MGRKEFIQKARASATDLKRKFTFGKRRTSDSRLTSSGSLTAKQPVAPVGQQIFENHAHSSAILQESRVNLSEYQILPGTSQSDGQAAVLQVSSNDNLHYMSTSQTRVTHIEDNVREHHAEFCHVIHEDERSYLVFGKHTGQQFPPSFGVFDIKCLPDVPVLLKGLFKSTRTVGSDSLLGAKKWFIHKKEAIVERLQMIGSSLALALTRIPFVVVLL